MMIEYFEIIKRGKNFDKFILILNYNSKNNLKKSCSINLIVQSNCIIIFSIT